MSDYNDPLDEPGPDSALHCFALYRQPPADHAGRIPHLPARPTWKCRRCDRTALAAEGLCQPVRLSKLLGMDTGR